MSLKPFLNERVKIFFRKRSRVFPLRGSLSVALMRRHLRRDKNIYHRMIAFVNDFKYLVLKSDCLMHSSITIHQRTIAVDGMNIQLALIYDNKNHHNPSSYHITDPEPWCPSLSVCVYHRHCQKRQRRSTARPWTFALHFSSIYIKSQQSAAAGAEGLLRIIIINICFFFLD